MPPRSWVDKDTGHRVWRLSDEPNSGGFYFNINAYTPDNKQMIYTAPDGIHVLDLATRTDQAAGGQSAGHGDRDHARPRHLHTLVAGHKTNSVFYTTTDAAGVTSVYKADTNTGAIRKLVEVPNCPTPPAWRGQRQRGRDPHRRHLHRRRRTRARSMASNMPRRASAARRGATGQPRRQRSPGPALSAHQQGPDDGPPPRRRLPLVLFTLRLEPGPNGDKPGDLKPLLHSTDWINHLLFSPTDPSC